MHEYKCTECDGWLVRIRKIWACSKCDLDDIIED
jgi:ribosomal protein L37AE/L43A